MPRRNKHVTILVVPGDNVEPHSIRVRTGTLRVLYVVAFALFAHMVVGGYYYWKYAELERDNLQTLDENRQLRKDNQRVIALADQFYALEGEYQKVRSLLGVEPEQVAGVGAINSTNKPTQLVDNIVPAVQTNSRLVFKGFERRDGYLLTPRKDELYAYSENMPTLLPVKGVLTQDFQKEEWFGPRRHGGIDIVAKQGSVIRAAGAGTIVFANWTHDLGNLIIVNHGGGILSYYGHNQRLLKSEKRYVKKGEPVALLGSSGRSSGPHLHFEIRQNGQPVDPKEFVVAFQENNE